LIKNVSSKTFQLISQNYSFIWRKYDLVVLLNVNLI